ncbi:alpha-L-arabinofuranosidase C-terminal domain-containing protein [Arthrobacter sp. efr-133-TYG-118]|uniref:alpha-L-arabinofuranosidase C-terminal domain-containing protein n=1 Tax=Arthrobacter sp. efr-133-TYG-118 TaxID=3040279 RepID=UPI0025502655|nr:alpha-L-arabinofuranosidase C-terminal domain-containing protein [Arthrobacter sp. efr-133-TYG-118]
MTSSDGLRNLTVRTGAATKKVSPTLFGLFLEDINFACDGGLNANLVNNYSFDGVYLVNGVIPYLPLELVPEEHRERLANTPPELLTTPANTPAGRLVDHLRHWTIQDGRIEASEEKPIAPGAGFARVESAGSARLENLGYPGNRPGMPFATGRPLLFSTFVRADDFIGAVEVRLLDLERRVVAAGVLPSTGSGWQEAELRLVPTATGLGSLQLVLNGSGRLDLDEVKLIPTDHWGADNPRWGQGRLRRDLVETMAALAPRFLRFPGGCIVEGCGDGSHYDWKKTVGRLETRRQEYNLWGQARADGDYSQSNQVGFYEYFLLCEDLGMEPVPVVWAGISCQTRMDKHLSMESPEFATVVQDAVDLIDWATGDPATSPWAALRAEAGHPDPFPLRYLGIGNENFGPEYLEHFARIKEAVDQLHPGLTTIVTGGVVPSGERVDPAWTDWGHDAQILVDEHFYNSPAWFLNSTDRYDGYPRGGAKVFLGEYAAHLSYDLGDRNPAVPESLLAPEPNTWLSALAEAAFLTGVERNSDIVGFCCYAPLLNLVENGQWPHNLIDFSPTEVVRTTNYLVQELFATRIGERIVPVDGDLPTTMFASASIGKGMLHIKLVNTGSSALDVALQIDRALDCTAEAVLLHGPLDAINRLAFDSTPRISIQPERSDYAVRGGEVTLHLEATSVLALSVHVEDVG